MAAEKDPATTIYEAVRADVLQALAVAARENGPGILWSGAPAWSTLKRLDEKWNEVQQLDGDRGRVERMRIAFEAARNAIAIHESLPGAPKAPGWLQDLTRTRGTLSGPQPAVSLVDAVDETLSDYWQAGKQVVADTKKGLTTALAIGGAVVAGVLGLLAFSSAMRNR